MSNRRPGQGAMDRLIPARERLLSRVRILPNDCWEWTGFVTPQGYGACGYQGKRNVLAHRAVYIELVGPIADGMTLDHLCHTRDSNCQAGVRCPHRRCVNPEHLEQVTAAENSSRGDYGRRTHCPHGHPYDEENTLVNGGRRFCRACQRQHANRNSALRRAARPADWKRKPRTRPTHCIRGHAFDAENTYVTPNGTHGCKECMRMRKRMRRAAAFQNGAVA